MYGNLRTEEGLNSPAARFHNNIVHFIKLEIHVVVVRVVVLQDRLLGIVVLKGIVLGIIVLKGRVLHVVVVWVVVLQIEVLGIVVLQSGVLHVVVVQIATGPVLISLGASFEPLRIECSKQE